MGEQVASFNRKSKVRKSLVDECHLQIKKYTNFTVFLVFSMIQLLRITIKIDMHKATLMIAKTLN